MERLATTSWQHRPRGAERHALKSALMTAGLSADAAENWCLAWEVEAARQSIRPDSAYFWAAGRGWIDAQRSFSRVGR
jgi:hypothetical protein